jgi:peptidoglycan/LPS O-acetylase OafA/YrhL
MQKPGVYIYHLWTITVEIKYYFIIPLICVFCAFVKHVTGWLSISFLLCSIFCFLNEAMNIFNITSEDLAWNVPEKYTQLRVRFAVFFYGSVVAILLTMLESNESFMKHVKNSYIQKLIFIAKVCVVYYCCRYRTEYSNPSIATAFNQETIPALIWSVVIILMILGHPNFITNFFGLNRFLTSYGQYSFGAYLWHVLAVVRLREYTFLDVIYMRSELSEAIFAVLISYCFGYLFFCVVENPLIIFANYLCKKLDGLSVCSKSGQKYQLVELI